MCTTIDFTTDVVDEKQNWLVAPQSRSWVTCIWRYKNVNIHLYGVLFDQIYKKLFFLFLETYDECLGTAQHARKHIDFSISQSNKQSTLAAYTHTYKPNRIPKISPALLPDVFFVCMRAKIACVSYICRGVFIQCNANDKLSMFSFCVSGLADTRTRIHCNWYGQYENNKKKVWKRLNEMNTREGGAGIIWLRCMYAY